MDIVHPGEQPVTKIDQPKSNRTPMDAPGFGRSRCPVCWSWWQNCKCGYAVNYNFGESIFGSCIRISEEVNKKTCQRASEDEDRKRATDIRTVDGSISIATRVQEGGHNIMNSMTLRYYPPEKSEFKKILREGYADQYLIVTVDKKGSISYWILVDLSVLRWIFTIHGDQLLEHESYCQYYDQAQPYWRFNLLKMKDLPGAEGLIITNLPQFYQMSFKF
jgi:hypothetical protein